MKLNAIAAAAAVLALGVAPALASAQTTAPISLIYSDAQPQIADASAYNTLGIAQVSFVNTSNVPATEVDFTLSSNGEPLATLRDVGTFAPNVTIEHTFANDRTARDQQLSIAQVKFADGTVWVNDAPLPLGQRAVHDWMSTDAGLQ
jgi:hypothetical protein